MRIAVAGGTGQVGSHVVAAARARGHDVVVLSRSTGVDLVTGSGVAAALEGADAVIDVVSVTTLGTAESIAFFEATTRTLLAAEAKAGVGHHVALSIVGIERAPERLLRRKARAGATGRSGAVPWTILRATQFHEFAAQIYARAKIGPFHVAPQMRTQPIAAREVAEHLVDLAEAGPAGRVPDLAGPREESLVEMVRAYARRPADRARGSRRCRCPAHRPRAARRLAPSRPGRDSRTRRPTRVARRALT